MPPIHGQLSGKEKHPFISHKSSTKTFLQLLKSFKHFVKTLHKLAAASR